MLFETLWRMCIQASILIIVILFIRLLISRLPRLEHVLKTKKPALAVSIVTVLVIIVCVVCFLTVPDDSQLENMDLNNDVLNGDYYGDMIDVDNEKTEFGDYERWMMNGQKFTWSVEDFTAGTISRMDLNLDGVGEELDFNRTDNGYEIVVNDSRIEIEPGIINDYLYMMTLDQDRVYLAVVRKEKSGPVSHLYAFENERVYDVGEVPFFVMAAESRKGSRQIRGKMVTDLIWEESVKCCAEFSESGLDINVFDNYTYTATGYNVLLKEPLYVFTERNASEAGFYLEPQYLRMVSTDAKDWIYVDGQYGESGWFRLNNNRLMDNDYVLATDIMERLSIGKENIYGECNQFTIYEGYLDNDMMKNNAFVKDSYDIDGDGLSDRIYRDINESVYEAEYRIEFGNKDILITAPVSSSLVCNWNKMELTNDSTPEIVCNYYSPLTDPFRGLVDIQVYTKKGNTYELIEMPVSKSGKIGYDISYVMQNESDMYAYCDAAGFEQAFTLSEQEKKEYNIQERGNWSYRLCETLQPYEWQGKPAVLLQQRIGEFTTYKTIYSIITISNGVAECEWMGTYRQKENLSGENLISQWYETFKNFSGSMDETFVKTLYFVNTPDDLDGDMKKDTVSRQVSGSQARYTVDFASGVSLQTSWHPKELVCDWERADVTADGINEIICYFKSPFSEGATLYDIEIYKKNGKLYQAVSLPQSTYGGTDMVKDLAGGSSILGYDICYELISSERMRIYSEAYDFSQELEYEEAQDEDLRFKPEGVCGYVLGNKSGCIQWNGKIAFYFQQMLGGKRVFKSVYVVLTFSDGVAKCEWMGTDFNAAAFKNQNDHIGYENDGNISESIETNLTAHGIAALDVAVLGADSDIKINLNGDSKDESLSLQIDGNTYTLTIAEKTINEIGICADNVFVIEPKGEVSLRYVALICENEGGIETRFYSYHNDEIISSTPVLYDIRECEYDRVKGTITKKLAFTRIFDDVVYLTWWFNPNSHKVQLKSSLEYELENANVKWVNCYAGSLTLFEECDELSESKYVRTKRVTFLKTDLKDWVYVLTEEGEKGWLQILEDGTVPCVHTASGLANVAYVFLSGFSGDKFE